MSNIEPKCSYPECGPACRKDCPPAASTNIEPTEEQKQAARDLYNNLLIDFNMGVDIRPPEALARLLAEREAKLREEVATLNANNDQLVRDLKLSGFCYPASNVARFIVHDRLESSGDWYDPATSRIMHMDPAKAFAMKDEIDALRARVAEMEAEVEDTVGCEGCGKRLPYACALPTEDPVYLCARCVSPMHMEREAQHLARIAELEARVKVDAKNFYALADENAALHEREAQHLADIKALMGCCRGLVHDVDRLMCGIDVGRHAMVMRATLQRLAHYDDAKAAEGVDRLTKGET